MSKHYDIDPRAEEACDNILHFVECMTTFLIPIGKSDKKIKKAKKEIKALIKDYKKGKVEIFRPEFYDMLENDDSSNIIYTEPDDEC